VTSLHYKKVQLWKTVSKYSFRNHTYNVCTSAKVTFNHFIQVCLYEMTYTHVYPYICIHAIEAVRQFIQLHFKRYGKTFEISTILCWTIFTCRNKPQGLQKATRSAIWFPWMAHQFVLLFYLHLSYKLLYMLKLYVI